MNTKIVKNIREPLKKPRPLKSAAVLEQMKEVKESSNTKAAVENLLSELENLNIQISNSDFDQVSTADISAMCLLLKKNGEELDSTHKEALDRYFSTLRNICREDRLDALSRLRLLEIIEMRAMHWRLNENLCNYFNSRFIQLEEANERQSISGSVSPTVILNTQNQNFTGNSLTPGEFVRSSGKFSKPTKIAGKNYFKDEIVIRNCDSGKVMGIKGRRVHMIEELSDTVISFQRVNAGARDRLVQITGPHEEAISHAKYLVEDTIKRNVSPVRDTTNVSELIVDNQEQMEYGTSCFDRNTQPKRNLTHSYSMSDALSKDFTVPVYVGNDVIVLSGSKTELLKTAKAVLIDYFSREPEILEKEPSLLSQSKNNVISSNQRFCLKKQASLKENLPFSSVRHGYRRQSSSMSSSSDDILADEESDVETINPPTPAPIPPPSYAYSREFLLDCSRLTSSRVPPPDYEHLHSQFPEIIIQPSVMFDPSSYVLNEN